MRSGDYRAARIGAAAALVGVLVVLLVIDALSHEYELQSVTLIALLTAVGGLLGLPLMADVLSNGPAVFRSRSREEVPEVEDERRDI